MNPILWSTSRVVQVRLRQKTPPASPRHFKKVREHRDLLFVDQRGTGKSHPLDCTLYNPNDLQSYLGYFFPLEDIRKCRAQLEANADLKLYTTDIAIDDMDEVRAALGYERFNLFGGSYGTRAALTYLKRYPKRVRTAILQGVSPPNSYLPSDFPQGNERALQGVLAECAADEACNEPFRISKKKRSLCWPNSSKDQSKLKCKDQTRTIASK